MSDKELEQERGALQVACAGLEIAYSALKFAAKTCPCGARSELPRYHAKGCQIAEALEDLEQIKG